MLALQYPQTTFTITRGYANTPLTNVSSLSLLTKTTYYYDATNEYLILILFLFLFIFLLCFYYLLSFDKRRYLYVMYLEDNGSLVNNAGFPEYGYGASCIPPPPSPSLLPPPLFSSLPLSMSLSPSPFLFSSL